MSRSTVDWWKYTATSAVSILIVIGGAWMAGAKDWVTRDEVAHLVKENSPYMKDQSRLTAELQFIRETVIELRSDNREAAKRIESLQREVSQLSAKLERP